jgi:hypothetical protein
MHHELGCPHCGGHIVREHFGMQMPELHQVLQGDLLHEDCRHFEIIDGERPLGERLLYIRRKRDPPYCRGKEVGHPEPPHSTLRGIIHADRRR